MINPEKCQCGSVSWERKIVENRYICAICKRPLWQLIETAPKDDTDVLIFCDDGAGASVSGESSELSIKTCVKNRGHSRDVVISTCADQSVLLLERIHKYSKILGSN